MTIAMRVEICIVGGGIVGLSLARELALRGREVAVLEAARVGEQAAARVAAGMLAPASEADLSDPRLTDLALAAHAMYGGWAAAIESETGIETGYDDTGTLLVALNHDDLALIEHLHSFQRERGLKAQRLTAREARETEPYLSPTIVGALRTADAQVNPRSLLRALPVSLERAGATLLEETRVTAVTLAGDSAGDGYVVTRECGGVDQALHAQKLVIAAGAWSKRIASPVAGMPLLPLPLRPVKGQILRLRGPRLIRHVVRTPEVYLVPRADGELVVGASMEEQGFDDRPTAGQVHDLLHEARRVLAGVTELELAECGVGFRPALRDHMPAIGCLDGDGLYVAVGHFRNGVELAPITAKLLADVICGEDPDPLIAPFAPSRFQTAVATPG